MTRGDEATPISETDEIWQWIDLDGMAELIFAAADFLGEVFSVDWLSWFSELVTLVIGIAWPLALITGLLLFRQQLADVLNRLVKAGKEGLEFVQPPQTAPPATEISPTDALSMAENFPEDFKPLAEALDAKLEEAIPRLMEARQTNDRDALKLGAIDAWAALLLEKVYRTVWGSQIEAIEFLKDQGGSAPIQALRTFYDSGSKKNVFLYARYSFEQWLEYLEGAELVGLEADIASVRPLGRALLPYVQQHKYERYKAG